MYQWKKESFFFGRRHVESCGVQLTSNKKKQLCGLHADSSWSSVRFMWSHGVHKKSMGQGKVHHFKPGKVKISSKKLVTAS